MVKTRKQPTAVPEVPDLEQIHPPYAEARRRLGKALGEADALNAREEELRALLREARGSEPAGRVDAYLESLDSDDGGSNSDVAVVAVATLRAELEAVWKKKRLVSSALVRLRATEEREQRVAARLAFEAVRPGYVALLKEVHAAAVALAEVTAREAELRRRLKAQWVTIQDLQTVLASGDFNGAWYAPNNQGSRLGRLIHEIETLTGS